MLPARECVSTFDVGPPRAVEVAGGRDDHAGIADVAAPVTAHRVNLPLPAFIVPPQRLNLGAEPGVLAKSVFVGKRDQILLVLRALRVVAAPVRVHLTRQRVIRRRCVDTDAGVGGGEPRAADFGVAVEDLVAHPLLGGRQRDVDAGDAGTDDGDSDGIGNGHGAWQRGLWALEAALFEEQIHVLVVHRLQPSAMGNSRAKSRRSSAGKAVGRGGSLSASITALINAADVSGSVTPARSGGSGMCEIFGP